LGGRRRAGKGERAEAAVARVEVVEGHGQVGGGKVRPHARHKAELGIGTFPEQEIAEALLASRANEQVDVGRARPAVGLAEARGRFQLPEEKAKRVRVPIPSPGAASTIRRTARTPRRWPARRGRPRASAHRPFPSMTMATWSRPDASCSKALCIMKYHLKKRE